MERYANSDVLDVDHTEMAEGQLMESRLVREMLDSGRRPIILAFLVGLLAWGCSGNDSGGDGLPATDGPEDGVVGEDSTSTAIENESASDSLTEDPCTLFDRGLAQIVHPGVGEGEPFLSATESTCRYWVASSPPVREITYGEIPIENALGSPVENAERVSTNPQDFRPDADHAEYEIVSGLGDEAAFIYILMTYGGSSQDLTWSSNGKVFFLEMEDIGDGGNVASRRSDLEQLANEIIRRME